MRVVGVRLDGRAVGSLIKTPEEFYVRADWAMPSILWVACTHR
jgi:hypothetical protein